MQDEKACSLILLLLSNEVLYEVSEEKIAFALWLKLRLKAFGNGDEAFASRLSVTNFARWQKNKKEKGSKKNKVDLKDICSYCKEPSHWKKDCLKKVKKYFVALVVQNDSSSKNDLVLVVVGEQPQQYSEQWVLDSGYSYHMCPHRSLLVMQVSRHRLYTNQNAWWDC